MSIQKGVLPDTWKIACVIPIHKKDDKLCVSNYRPISLTSIGCKLMERVIVKHLIEHINVNKLISDSQFAYLPGRSCQMQLLEVTNKIVSAMNDGFQCDSVFLDYSKAFDSVVHSKLVYKLR